MAFSIVQGEPTGMSNPAPMAEVGPKPEAPKPQAPMTMAATAGTPGANPTANYRRFDMDGGEGSMGHHWAGVERGQE